MLPRSCLYTALSKHDPHEWPRSVRGREEVEGKTVKLGPTEVIAI